MNLKNRIFTILTIISLFSLLLSCSKSSDPVPEVDRTGNYFGSLSVYLDGKFVSTTNNAQLSIVGTNKKGEVSILTAVSVTLKATISGNTITIPRTVTSQVSQISMTEYGGGTFNGTTLTIEINQELQPTGSPATRLRYSFVGKK